VNNVLDEWVFRFNSSTGYWYSTNRDNYFALFNGLNEDVIKSKEISTLTEIITKFNGDIKKIRSSIN
jgi:hypothetical protein